VTDTTTHLLGSTYDLALGAHEPHDTHPEDHFDAGPFESLYALESALRRYPGLHLRSSEGPGTDTVTAASDAENGLLLPGLPAHPLQPEDWWYRPVADWLARQVLSYGDPDQAAPERFAWVLSGRVVGRGPDCKPLLADVVPVARLGDGALAEARERYRQRFERTSHAAPSPD